MVTEALVVRESAPAVIAPRTLDEMISLAERLATSQLLPVALRGKVPDVLMQIMAGQELGLYSMASLRSFHIIEGKPTMAADAMVAVVLGSGKAEYFRRVGEGSAESVTYETKRKGEPAQRCTWTWQMAKDAALSGKDNWRLYRRAMLASRAKSELARDVYPDVLAGCYTTDEIRDGSPNAPTPREDIQDAEFVDAPSTATVERVYRSEREQTKADVTFDLSQYPEISDIQTAASMEELQALGKKFEARKLGPGPAYDAVKAAYKARVQWLKAEAATKAKEPEAAPVTEPVP